MKTTEEVFKAHLSNRLEGKVEKDIEENFSNDIVILSRYGVFNGHEGVRKSSSKLTNQLGDDAVFKYTKKITEGDFAFLEWTGESDKKEVKDGADSFYIKDGKIVFQSIHYTVSDK